MDFIKKYWVLVLVLILGLLFRLINLDKSGGLWYDEMTIYAIASHFKTDLHRFLLFPLYYIIYHGWINLFGNSDLTIRLMSVFFDVLGILSAFFVGRQLGVVLETNKNKVGICYSLLYALNSSFIYYAQEAKFYSLTFFLVNILMYCWLRFIHKSDNKNFILYCIASLILILSYVSQSLLVLILYIATLFVKTDEKKKLILYPIVFLPVVIFCLIVPKYFSGNFDAVSFDNSFVLLMLQNWFSPVLSGLQNNIPNYHIYLLAHIFNIKFLLFILFPVLFMLYILGVAIKNYKFTRVLFSGVLVYILFHILASFCTSYSVLVRYTLPILPIVLLICAAGLSCLKKKFVLILFIIFNVLGIVSLSGAPRMPRPDGYRLLAEGLLKNQVDADWNFVLPIRTELLDKYFDINGKRLSLYVLNSPEAQKTYLSESEINGIRNDANKNSYYKRFLASDTITPEFTKYIKDEFVNGKSLVVLKDNSICMFTNDQLKIIVKSENYDRYPLQFLRLSKLTNDMITVLKTQMKLVDDFSIGNWEIFVFKL